MEYILRLFNNIYIYVYLIIYIFTMGVINVSLIISHQSAICLKNYKKDGYYVLCNEFLM